MVAIPVAERCYFSANSDWHGSGMSYPTPRDSPQAFLQSWAVVWFVAGDGSDSHAQREDVFGGRKSREREIWYLADRGIRADLGWE